MTSPDSRYAELVMALPRLRRFARKLTIRSPIAADDLVQQACLRAVEKWDIFQPGTNRVSWLLTIVANSHTNMLRREIARERYEATAEAPAFAADDPSIGLVVRDVARDLAGRPAEQTEPLRLIGLLGLSYADAAEIMGVPDGTIRSRLSRSRERLRALAF